MVDDLFRSDFSQTVIPPLVQDSAGQQQAATKWYSGDQFPSSWSSYLSKGGQQQQQQQQGEQESQQQQQQNGTADVLSNVASNGSGSSDTLPRNSHEAKQQRIREKNRKAMKRFRERQREKKEASESRLKEVADQLQSLQLENERLMSQNRTLKLASMCNNTFCENQEPQATPTTTEWEPRKGWSDFNPQATMLLHLGALGDPPVRITCQQMRSMTHQEMTDLVRGYVMRAAPLLVEANDDLASPAAQELQSLKYELNALAAHCAMNNPVLMHSKWGVSPEGATMAPLDEPLSADVKQHCLHLMRVLKITPEQQATMVKVHQLVITDIRRLKQDRSNILQVLADMHAAEAGTPEPKRFSKILSALKQLTLNTEDMHRCHCIYGASMWSTNLNCIQVAKVVIHSFPNPPNLWLVTTAAAELPLDGLLSDPELNKRVQSRYEEIWKWHSNMARSGRMRSCPLLTSCEHFDVSAPAGSLGTPVTPINDDLQLFRESGQPVCPPAQARPPCDVLAE